MSDNPKQNGWNEYSRLVLAELEKLNNKVDGLNTEINAINQSMSKIEQIKDEIDVLKEWKNKVDEVSSPTQLRELQKEVENLKTFKTMSTTIWVVVQIIFGVAATLFGLYLKSN